MAAIGLPAAGPRTISPMNQLHRLPRFACWSASPAPSPHPCKLVFFVYLPTSRLHPTTSTRRRLPLSSAPFCGNGELEIVSIKELEDGFLHFSFGIPNKVDDLSSSCAEHLAGNLSVPKRLPSKFSKKLPIPVAAVRRKRKEKSSSKEESAEATAPTAVKETDKPSSRPKSCFLKRSPIPRGKSEALFVRGNVSNGTAVGEVNSMPQTPKVASITDGVYARPTSIFVRNSPIPPSKLKRRHVTPANSDLSPMEACKDAPAVQVTSSAGTSLRPKSSFFRRLPNAKNEDFSQEASSKNKPSSRTLLAGREMTSVEESAKIQDMAEVSTPYMADLENYKLSELKNIAKLKGVKGYSKLKKADLLDMLKSLDI